MLMVQEQQQMATTHGNLYFKKQTNRINIFKQSPMSFDPVCNCVHFSFSSNLVIELFRGIKNDWNLKDRNVSLHSVDHNGDQ